METIGDNSAGKSISGEEVTLPPFKEIRKSTIGETYSYFNKLINGKSIKNMTECVSIDTHLPLFDESLRLALIDSLRLKDEVLKILLSQNEYQIKRALQCDWFFQDLTVEICTSQIFPHVSFSLRCKIINRLSRNLKSTSEAEKYFTFIRANFDNRRAEFILPKCTPEFVLDYVKKFKPDTFFRHSARFCHVTGSRILLNISKRYPEIGVKILSLIFEMHKEEQYKLSSYEKVLLYIAGYHPDLLVPFLKKYHLLLPSGIFGRKLTKKLGRKLKVDLLPGFMEDLIFKEKVLFSILSAEEQAKFIAVILRFYSKIDNWCSWQNRVSELLKLVPDESRLLILESAFKMAHNKDFSNSSKFWHSELLETLPLKSRLPFVEKIERFVEGDAVEFENLSSDSFHFQRPEEYIYLYDSSVALERLKEILRKTPEVTRREIILRSLLESCRINKDTKTLQEVADFVATRHRNDDQSVIFRLLNLLFDYFPISALTSSSFEKLNDLVYFLHVKDPKNKGFYRRWKEREIYHRLEYKMNVESQIKNFFEFAVLKPPFSYTFTENFKSTHSKFLILALCSEAVSWMKNNNTSDEPLNTREILLNRLLSTCESYNVENRSDRISLREILGLKEILEERIQRFFTELPGEIWPIEIWEKHYGDVLNSSHKAKVLFYFLRRRPDLIGKHLEGILNILLCNHPKTYNPLLTFLKKNFSFLGKSEKVKEILLNEFRSGDSVGKRKAALEVYSHLCTIEEFERAVESHMPKEEKVGGGCGEGLDEIQMLVPRLIKNVRPRWRNLEFISKFFFGDFLKAVLPSFYSCCLNTRCDLVVSFLKKRLEELPPKVSYIKDIMRLILETSDRKARTEFCLDCWKRHEHYSIRSVVLGYAWRFFVEQPTEESFGILEKFILDCDETTIRELPHLKKIPGEFLSAYVDVLWRFYENQKPLLRSSCRRNLLEGFDESNVGFLEPEFCESVIRSNLFVPSTGIPVEDFAVLYVAAKPDAAESRARFVLDLVKEREPDASAFSAFLNVLVSRALRRASEFEVVFAVLLENWPQFPVGVLFEERLLVTYHNLRQKTVKEFGVSDSAVLEFGKELRKLYGRVDRLNELLSLYVSALKRFFGSYGTSNAVLALRGLVSGSKDTTVGVLGILSLPEEAVEWYKRAGDVEEEVEKSKKDLDEFVKSLRAWDDDIVEVYLGSTFGVFKGV